MYRLSRLTPHCQIVLWLGAFAVLVNAALTALSATPLLAWLPETTTGTGFLEDSRERVAEALDEYRLGRVPASDHLAVLVGISNLREAAELSVISEAVGPGWRFLGVAGAGSGMGSIREYARLVLESELRPDVVVLGLGLHQLVDPRASDAAPPGQQGVFEYLQNGDLRSALILVRNSTWIYSRRQDINVTTEAVVLDLRRRLFDRFGVDTAQPARDPRGPWREMVRMDWPDHFSSATLAAQEKAMEEAGMFDLETYRSSPAAHAMLMSVIRAFQRQGSRVVLVLVPESSVLNRRIPHDALDVLVQHLRAEFSEDAPLVMDYRQTVRDEGFVDLPHLNRTGRMLFSRTLGEDLRELLTKDRAPLMASQ